MSRPLTGYVVAAPCSRPGGARNATHQGFSTGCYVRWRNLWPLILVHGSIDTLGFVVRYLREP